MLRGSEMEVKVDQRVNSAPYIPLINGLRNEIILKTTSELERYGETKDDNVFITLAALALAVNAILNVSCPHNEDDRAAVVSVFNRLLQSRVESL